MATYTITTNTNATALTNRTGTRSAVPWTRATTTATVTFANHNFVTNDVIQVTVSSDTGAIALGSKTITVTGANTFTFACTNAGAASGTITYTAPDNFNIDGATLTIDEDYGLGNASQLNAALGTITLSASLGGVLDIDARNIRYVSFTGGSGTVPASGTTISQGGVSAVFVSVQANHATAPVDPGGAMPASGLLKFKNMTGGDFSAGAFTAGITATSSGASAVGWMIVNGVEARTITASRLNTVRLRGEWMDIGLTQGLSVATYNLPANGKSVYYPGVWVETAAGSGTYEFYPNAGSLTATSANVPTDSVRGKVCWITSLGVLSFQNDGTNSTGGFLPTIGLKIRIPNLILQNVAIATQATVALPNATLATRYDFTTTGGPSIEISKVTCAWYLGFTQAYSVSINNSSTFSQILISEIASPLSWNDIGIGQEAANTQTALSITLCSAGGTISNLVASRATLPSASTYVAAISDSDGFSFSGCTFQSLVARANASADGVALTRCFNTSFSTTKLIGGGYVVATCAGLSIYNGVYLDAPATTTPTANPTSYVEMSAVCTDVVIDGLTFGGLSMTAPYNALVAINAAKCARVKVRNFGTAAAPLQCGSSEVFGAAWTRATSTITVTSTAHGLKTGDSIILTQTSDTAAAPLGVEAITVTNANTFTFTGVNAGAASGTLAYYGANSAAGVALAAASAASDVKIQRVYLRGLRGAVVSDDNSANKVTIESVWQDPPRPFAINLAMLNMEIKGFGGAYGTTAQTAVYGFSWIDFFNADEMPVMAPLTWTRTTTVATVTASNHKLKTGDTIFVVSSSDLTAVARGVRTVTVLTKDTFTITATNAGAASGDLSLVQYQGTIRLMMNEKTVDTNGLYTINAGNPAFTSAGGLYMPSVGDEITFETPYFIKGHSTFGRILPALTGGAAAANYDFTYDIDQGSGFSGTFKNLMYYRANGSGTSGAFTITVTDATGVAVNDYVFGNGIAPMAKVVSVVSNTITLDIANTSAVSGNIGFSQLPSETVISTSVGFKLRFKIKTVTANTAVIASLSISTSFDNAGRAQVYVLDTLSFTVNGLVAGSEVRAYEGTNPAVATEIGGTESSGTSFTFSHSSGGQAGYIIVHKEDYEPIYVPLTYATEDESLLVQPRFDRNYGNP